MSEFENRGRREENFLFAYHRLKNILMLSILWGMDIELPFKKNLRESGVFSEGILHSRLSFTQNFTESVQVSMVKDCVSGLSSQSDSGTVMVVQGETLQVVALSPVCCPFMF